MDGRRRIERANEKESLCVCVCERERERERERTEIDGAKARAREGRVTMVGDQFRGRDSLNTVTSLAHPFRSHPLRYP